MSSADAMADVAKIQLLAEQILDLSKTHDYTPKPGLGPQAPIITKSKELITALSGPMDLVLTNVMTIAETTCIRTLWYLKVFQAMPMVGSIALADLATITTAQAALLERLLRVVVGAGFVQQLENGKYAHTHLSLGFAGTNGAAEFLELVCDEILSPFVRLPEYLEAKRETQGLVEPGGEQSATHNILSWHAGQEGKTAFEILAQSPERLARLQRGMGMAAQLNPFVGVYDFGKLVTDESERAVFVDVGGGKGHAISELLKAHQNIRPEQCVLQDLPPSVELARTSGLLPAGVQLQSHDFYEPQPVKGAKAYHIRAIAHDLSDANLVRVLKQLAAVMKPDSRVLIADNILPERGGPAMTAFMDMAMFTMGGKERTEANFGDVLGDAGLDVAEVHRAGGGTSYAVVEARLKG